VATPTKSVEEIVAKLISREALMHPRLRGLWAIQGTGALVLSLILLTDFFAFPLPFSLDFLGAAGRPLRVLLVIAFALEGLLVTHRFARHKEPPYGELAQSAGLALAAGGAILAGIGVVVYLAWTGLFASYYPAVLWVEPFYYILMLIGPSILLAALPALAGSLIRPLVRETVVEP
jgi:hypothetical protein